MAADKIRSCFAMTEPAPGAGADPTALTTRAERTTHGWNINGRKWFITGAHGASFAIVMARTSGEPGSRTGVTMFLVDIDTPGFSHDRHIDTLDESMFAGHSELAFGNVEVGDDAILGEVDHGFRYAQVRLGPARMTHCICGALGVSGDIALSRLYREVRPFRIYDGPSETHRWAIARRILRTIDRAHP